MAVMPQPMLPLRESHTSTSSSGTCWAMIRSMLDVPDRPLESMTAMTWVYPDIRSHRSSARASSPLGRLVLGVSVFKIL